MLTRASQARHVRPRSALRRALVAIGVVLTLLVAGLVAAGMTAAARLNGNLTARDVTSLLGNDRPTKVLVERQQPLNVLLMGSDSREGANGFVGGDAGEGGRSDTTILLHLSADRKRAIGVSIPRDSMVPMPDCVKPDDTIHPGAFRMFNEAFSIGGPGCVQRTVEQLTGVYIDHYAVIDFDGFRRMVNALGTVRVCVPRDVDDTVGNISFRKGEQNLNGDQSLDYVRLRHGLDTTGDIGRIKRQQDFLGAMVRKATSTGTLTNPKRLFSFLDAATESLTLDPGLASLNALRKLAQQVNGIGLDKVQFVTVPNQPWPRDTNRLVWTEPRAGQLWQALRTDQPLSSIPAPSAAPVVGVAPSAVRVNVLNASGRPELGSRAVAELRAAGFQVVASSSSTPLRAVTSVRHDPAYDQSARTLKVSLHDAPSAVDASLGRTLVVLVGTDWSGVRRVTVSDGPAVDRPLDVSTAAQEQAC